MTDVPDNFDFLVETYLALQHRAAHLHDPDAQRDLDRWLIDVQPGLKKQLGVNYGPEFARVASMFGQVQPMSAAEAPHSV